MRIEVLYFDGCSNYLPAVDRLRTVLQEERLAAEVCEIEVKDESAAKALNFFGSPTIRVDGVDIEPGLRFTSQTRFVCRRYQGGLPSEEMIRTALKGNNENT